MGTKELEKEKKELEKQLNDDDSSTNSELEELEKEYLSLGNYPTNTAHI